MSRPIHHLRAFRDVALAACLLAALSVQPACVNPEEVLSINKVNLSFTRAKVVDSENENQPPDLDGDGAPDSPRYRPGDSVRKTVTLRNGSARNIPLRIFIDETHPTALDGAAFSIDTERSPPAGDAVEEPFNYLLESNAELEVTVLFEGVVEGVNVGRLQIISDAYKNRDRCEGVDTAGCIEVVLQGTVDCTSLHTEEASWDADLDGYCVAPEGFVLDSEEDCEDRPEVEGWRASPGLREEVCELGDSQLDTDCDGSVALITDRDSDGVCDLLDDTQLDENGDPLIISCAAIPDNGEGWTYTQALASACGLNPVAASGLDLATWLLTATDDCEDSSVDSDGDGVPDSASNFPGNEEVCEPGGLLEQRDNNCLSEDDDPSGVNWPPEGMVEYHRDRDGDTYGAVSDPTDSVWYCGGSPSEEFAPARPDSSVAAGFSCSSDGDCPRRGICEREVCFVQDCDDEDVERFPDAPVRCNGIDDNCDYEADQIASNPPALRDDSDRDRDGRPICSGEECSDPLSDSDPTVYDGAPELCDGKDNDCDGVVPTALGVDETDDDSDDYIPCQQEPLVLEICRCTDALTQGFAAFCDAQASPPVTEFCMPVSCNLARGSATNPEYCADGVDNDGDLESDCDDSDCWGTPICSPGGPNCALQSGDCDDFDSTVSPGADEEDGGVSRCDFEDNDCDGLLHPTETDDDGDGQPSVLGSGTECGPDGNIQSTADNDCNDTLATVYAGATEICDGIDNDCDGLANVNQGGLDELDNDGDGYVECAPAPSGLVGLAGGNDCNDDASDPVAANVYPFAPEIPDSYWDNGVFRWVDNQCAGNAGYDFGGSQSPGEYCFTSVTSSALNCSDPTFACMACAAGSETDLDQDGFTEAQGDCNDGPLSVDPSAASVSPGAVEICDGLDNDCDGQLMGAEVDSDLDGYVTCWPPPDSLTALEGGDCDDTQNAVNPSGSEVANGVDDDCNGLVDDGTSNFDDDGDGVSESGPDGNLSTTADNDCDDSDPGNFPGNTEVCDGLDNNCNGVADFSGASGNELDEDGDGYTQCADADCLDSGADLLAEVSGYPGGSSSADLAHRAAVAASIHPNAPELCDGWTNDCSEATTGGALAYVPQSSTHPNEFDDDGDLFVECDDGGDGSWLQNAAHANRLLSGGNDCLDLLSNSYASNVNPGASSSDICDGYDTDCSNGASSYVAEQADEQDDDGDGYIHCDGFQSAAAGTGGLNIAGGGDCLDEAGNTWSERVNPGPSVTDSCDGYDTNCTGGGSDNSPDVATENDDDGDGYVECALTANSNWVDPSGIIGGDDCLDVGSSVNTYSDEVHPGASEACDGYDTNCSAGSADSSPDVAAENDEDFDGYIECGSFVAAASSTGPQALIGGDDCLDNALVTGGLPLPYSNRVNPGASELCDGYDTNCSSGSSSADQSDEIDEDGDGYIECPGTFQSDAIAAGETHPISNLAGTGDCLDVTTNTYSGSVNPGANPSDVCDGYDTNCDGSGNSNPDDPAENDDDGDGYVECQSFVSSAAGTGGLGLTSGGDCIDDASNSYSDQINPGVATDVCDGYDTNCNNPSPSSPGAPDNVLENDDDLDSYVQCSGFVLAAANTGGLGLIEGADCLDVPSSTNSYSGAVSPGASEVCDGYDTNCSSVTAPSPELADEIDNDGDFYIECTNFVSAAAGTTSSNLLVGEDCDDTDQLDFPGGTETCNADDEDCDGTPDNGLDVDGDGVTPCGPDGTPGNSDDDCDDGDILNFPGNPELCDGADNDCDTVPDDNLDGDGDGVTTCGPDGNPATTADNDCDDGDVLDFPGGTETCNGDDEDCDGTADNGLDGDADGITTCGPDGIPGSTDDDCDDTLDEVFPGAPEICDGEDNDCDGNLGTDEPATVVSLENTSTLCLDNLDNDCDGDVDEDDSGCGWQFQTSGVTVELKDIMMRNSSRGWIVGDNGTILKTTDGGSSWATETSGTTSDLRSVHVQSNTRAWAVGNNGEILATTNGTDWIAQTSGVTSSLQSVSFVTNSLGWAVGDSGVVFNTTDGGDNWIDVSATVGSSGTLREVYFESANVGWIVGHSSEIYSTIDGGTNWIQQSTGVPTGTTWMSVTAISTSVAWVSGDSGKVLSTTDGGTNWTTTNTAGSILYGISFDDANTGWVTGAGSGVLATVDGGTSFSSQTLPSGSGTPRALDFATAANGWLVGAAGMILHTTSGGD